jgi:hypothetical protein
MTVFTKWKMMTGLERWISIYEFFYRILHFRQKLVITTEETNEGKVTTYTYGKSKCVHTLKDGNLHGIYDGRAFVECYKQGIIL